jgi:hypothetical protein
MNPMDVVLGVIGIALSVMIFSYLLGDNFFFRVALYVLVGFLRDTPLPSW